jgi:hypothetical protein
MRTITIRTLQRNLYRELEDLPVLITRRILVKNNGDEKLRQKTINLCVILPFKEDNQPIIEGMFSEKKEQEIVEDDTITYGDGVGVGVLESPDEVVTEVRPMPIDTPEIQEQTVEEEEPPKPFYGIRFSEKTDRLYCGLCDVVVFSEDEGVLHLSRMHGDRTTASSIYGNPVSVDEQKEEKKGFLSKWFKKN